MYTEKAFRKEICRDWCGRERPTSMERDICLRKETCIHGKRRTCKREKTLEKRPVVIDAEKETCHDWYERQRHCWLTARVCIYTHTLTYRYMHVYRYIICLSMYTYTHKRDIYTWKGTCHDWYGGQRHRRLTARDLPPVQLPQIVPHDTRHHRSLAVAVCCSVLQCVTVCCSVLQCVAVCFRVLQWDVAPHGTRDHRSLTVAVWYSVLQCGTVCCSVVQCVAVCCSVLQSVAVCCSVF